MTDRLAEIKAKWNDADSHNRILHLALEDVRWLIAEVERLRPDAERWLYVRENGPSCLYWGSELFGDYDNVTGDEADAAVDAARKTT